MAYNPYYPQGFYFQQNNPYLYQQQQAQPQQIQNGGFINVATIEDAYNWPVAPGNSVTFKIDNSPYVCTKTKGFSQLDQPIFEKYRLVKEEQAQNVPEKQPETAQEAQSCEELIKPLWDEINALKRQIDALKANVLKEDKSAKRPVKKEAEENE